MWQKGQTVDIADDPDDPQWPERFGSGKGIIVDPLGKHSRWVVIEVTESSLRDAVGSNIRFPKASLVPVGA
jgi:hypothetical protein